MRDDDAAACQEFIRIEPAIRKISVAAAAEAAKALAVFDFSQALAILAPMEKNLAEGHPAPDAGAKPPA